MPYSMNMKDEKEPQGRVLLPKGPRAFTVVNVEEATSKNGNQMFVWTVKDDETGHEDKVYAVAVQGKRWFLKALLYACGINPDAEGSYQWDIPDVKGKSFVGVVDHEENEFINRNGDTVKATQHRIVKAERIGANPDGVKSPDDIKWDE